MGSPGLHRSTNMDWIFAYTPQIWPPAFTALVLIALAIYSFRRRSVPGALPFAYGLLLGAVWMAGACLEVAAVDISTRTVWIKFQDAVLLPDATAVICFLLEYAWPGRWLTRRNLALLSIPCLLNVGMILTNDLHHLYQPEFGLDGGAIPLRGLGNWIFLAYAYGLMIVNLIVLAWLFIRSPQHRWPVVLMLAGQMGARVLYMLDAVEVIHVSLPIEVFAFWLPIPMYAIALFAFRILDPIPLARQVVIEQLRDGMLVVDPAGRVASLNPAIERILGTPARQVKGQLIHDLIPRYPDGLQTALDGTEAEITLPAQVSPASGHESRDYIAAIRPLKDWRGVEVGHLLLLHDVTEQKQAQAQIIEQQRSLAMLHEREQLARELHDSTAQVLGYADFQLEAISNHIQDGRATLSTGQAGEVTSHLAEAEVQLARLRRIVEEAQADMREYILNLRSAPSHGRPFFATLRSYLDGFSQNHDIQTELSIGAGIDEGCFALGTQLQRLRIIQEALSNARKHSAARRVEVTIGVENARARISVDDNGRGFDPDTKAADTGHHFGLRFMRERAEQIGGTLRVVSVPGQGTRVIVDVPMKG